MTDEQMKTLGLTKYGDIWALRSLAKIADGDGESAGRNLMQRLKQRIGDKQLSKKLKLSGNKNAKKDVRYIDVKWGIKECYMKDYTQVKTEKGGGTRKLKVPVCTKAKEVRSMAEGLFFPGGNSTYYGQLQQYDRFIANFDGVPVFANSTVEELYESSKINRVRLYLSTALISSATCPYKGTAGSEHHYSVPSESAAGLEHQSSLPSEGMGISEHHSLESTASLSHHLSVPSESTAGLSHHSSVPSEGTAQTHSSLHGPTNK